LLNFRNWLVVSPLQREYMTFQFNLEIGISFKDLRSIRYALAIVDRYLDSPKGISIDTLDLDHRLDSLQYL
jgi:hypothetical protein